MALVYEVEQWADSSGRLHARCRSLDVEASADNRDELEQEISNAIGRADRPRSGFTINWKFVRE